MPCNADGTTFIEGMSDEDAVQRRKLLALFDKVAHHGPRSIPQDRNHQLEQKIWQFRVDHLRVIYFYDEGMVVVCAHLYGKKRQKAPPGEIAAARVVREQYFAAKGSGALKLTPP